MRIRSRHHWPVRVVRPRPDSLARSGRPVSWGKRQNPLAWLCHRSGISPDAVGAQNSEGFAVRCPDARWAAHAVVHNDALPVAAWQKNTVAISMQG